MKNILFITIIALISFKCHSQISFKKGYYVNDLNERVECFIKYANWKKNSNIFEYKLLENSEPNKIEIENIKEFEIYNNSKYIKSNVNIDRSSSVIGRLSKHRDAVFKKEELFLEVLIEGQANLYMYKDSDLTRYFYSLDKSKEIKQLVFKSYMYKESRIAKNNLFRQQLYNDLKCSLLDNYNFKKVRYTKASLIKIIEKYNKCKNSNYVSELDKHKKDLFNLNIRPRVNNSSLFIGYPDSYFNVDLGSKTNFSFGIEAEFILPYYDNKWSIMFELSYTPLNFEKTMISREVSGGKYITKIDYTPIELSVGLRYYMFFNEDFKMFLNASVSHDYSSGEVLKVTRSDGSYLKTLNVGSGINSSVGIGCKYKNKYSLELRYVPSKKILEAINLTSDYKMISIIFGYTLL
ncbi:MAG: tRNA modification GTPase [Flavobacteriaceae bacterium]|nr:tRNA modification GTPase [Flavobacteriaceae bacterium]